MELGVAQASAHFQVIVEKAVDGWMGAVRGPLPIGDQIVDVFTSADEAKNAAYGFLVRLFMDKGIAEPRVPRDELKWQYV